MSASPIEYHFLYLHKTLFRHLKLHNKITIFTCGHIQNALSSLNSWWLLSILTSTFSLMTWVYFEDAVSSAEQLLPPTFPNTERNICMQAIKAGKKCVKKSLFHLRAGLVQWRYWQPEYTPSPPHQFSEYSPTPYTLLVTCIMNVTQAVLLKEQVLHKCFFCL